MTQKYNSSLPQFVAFIKYLKGLPYKGGLLVLAGILSVWFYFCLPEPLFSTPYSTVALSREGTLLGAKIAADEQWRFPPRTKMPDKYTQALLSYEDEYFYYHIGINPISVVKALWVNIKNGKTIRGASTLSQQVIRLSRMGKPRNIGEKIIEAILALRLECRYSKEEILALYGSYAPFGGNVVGIDMAAWRYFGTDASQLSWAETATLAVLPNAPSLIHLGKNTHQLHKKRDALLKKIYHKGLIDKHTYELALSEPLPQRPLPLPQKAPHLVELLAKQTNKPTLRTSISASLQHQLLLVAEKYHRIYAPTQVHNLAILVAHNNTAEVLGYVGNTSTTPQHSPAVDMIQSHRSTGSTLKPLLYGLMLQNGTLLPKELLPDVPINKYGFQPKNAHQNYSGAVPANRALQESLNVPFVELLQRYGYQKFYHQLRQMGFKGINKGPDHYGLSLILGGGEASLWELVQAYAQLSHTLHFYNQNGFYPKEKIRTLHLGESPHKNEPQEAPSIGAGAIYLTLQAMQELIRPAYEAHWQYHASAQPIAWKTGTSYGGRDAWAIGTTPSYTIGVWVGNASGEGRPEITGLEMAAPILLECFKYLPQEKHFTAPSEIKPTKVCQESGLRPNWFCPTTTTEGLGTKHEQGQCKYHQQIFVSTDEKYRVHRQCTSELMPKVFFTLPPIMEWYYAKANPAYTPLPPWHPNCSTSDEQAAPTFIYPKEGTIIQQGKQLSGEPLPFVAKVVYKGSGALQWYLGKKPIGLTHTVHSLPIIAPKGEHTLRCISSDGMQAAVQIRIVE